MKSKDNKISCCKKTSIGGQALIEGIMMRGPQKYAMAVRNTKGEMVVEIEENTASKRPAFFRLPIIRGVFGFIDSMRLGYKCLMRSAELSGLEDLVEESPRQKKKRLAKEAKLAAQQQSMPKESEPETVGETANETQASAQDTKREETEEKLPAWVMTLMLIVTFGISILFAIGLFIFLPTLAYSWLSKAIPALTQNGAAWNSLWKSAIEGVIKVMLLVGYMASIALMKDIRRTFMYHGAEHKTIFCYEAGLPLTVENVRAQKRFHPRCGTSFLILMLLVSIFTSFFIDPISIAITGSVLPTLWRVLVKILLIPIIVGFGYELIKLAGKHDNVFTRIISAPGVWLQHITVFEPTDDMIECAIAAVTPVIPQDGSDKW